MKQLRSVTSIGTAALALAAMLSQQTSNAALLAYEGFDYTAGQTYLGQNGGIGWGSIWQTNSTPVNNALTYSGSFNYTDGNGDQLYTTGNRAHFTGNGTAVSQTTGVGDNTGGTTGNSQGFRSFNFSRGTNNTTESTWISFMALRTGSTDVTVDAPPNDYLYGRAAGVQFFYNSANTTAVGSEHFTVGRATQSSETLNLANDTWGGYLQSGANSTKVSGVNWASSPADFILMRIDHIGSTVVDAANADTLRIWINPLLATLPSDASADITLNANEFNPGQSITRDLVFNRLRLFGGSENAAVGYGSMEMDEFRLGETFADVTPLVPEPTVATLAGVAVLGFILRRRS